MQTQKINSTYTKKAKVAYLYLSQSPGFSEHHKVADFLSLGRGAKNQLQLNDPHVSNYHARIERNSKGAFILRDTGSQNGTYLNGSKIKEAELTDNDQITVGTQKLIWMLSEMSDQNILRSKNPTWQKKLERFPAIAQSSWPVLLLGPSGTGKDRLAQAIHNMSDRKHSPFISVNCSALSETLIESELFGHTKGSFTGAMDNRKGAFETAQGGTLFLDEIGDLPLSLQPKLLRALENHEIKAVGSDVIKKTNVRIIAATHNNLKQSVQQKTFREDLYFRLHTLQIQTPKLVQRLEDFDSLLFLFAREEQVSFSYGAIERLKHHAWPGNIRELKNVVAKAAVLFKGQQVKEDDLDDLVDDFTTVMEMEHHKLEISNSLKSMEYTMIMDALVKYKGNQRRVSEVLRIPKSTLNDKIKRFGINIQKIKIEQMSN